MGSDVVEVVSGRGLLFNTKGGFQFGKKEGEKAGVSKKEKTICRMIGFYKFEKFQANAFGGYVGDEVREESDALKGRIFNGETEFSGDSYGSDHTEGVFVEALARITYGANDAVS